MELFPPLTAFYDAISEDARISLYMALLHQWNLNGGKNPILIERDKVMKAAKIHSRQTYNKCMNDLHDFNYIVYQPSVNTAIQSKISINLKKEAT